MDIIMIRRQSRLAPENADTSTALTASQMDDSTRMSAMNIPESESVKASARNAVSRAIKDGRLQPLRDCVCIFCGNPAHVYHHHSYDQSDWLNVEPLCSGCHKMLHLHGITLFIEERMELVARRMASEKRALRRIKTDRQHLLSTLAIARLEDDVECLAQHSPTGVGGWQGYVRDLVAIRDRLQRNGALRLEDTHPVYDAIDSVGPVMSPAIETFVRRVILEYAS